MEISILKKWTSRSFAICLRRVGSWNPLYLIKYFKYCKKILDFSIKYILQHVVKISANSEMVELESLLKLVELSWNDPLIQCFPTCVPRHKNVPPKRGEFAPSRH